jgi:hypothetical protein
LVFAAVTLLVVTLGAAFNVGADLYNMGRQTTIQWGGENVYIGADEKSKKCNKINKLYMIIIFAFKSLGDINGFQNLQ